MVSIDYVVAMMDEHDRLDILLLWKDPAIETADALKPITDLKDIGTVSTCVTYADSIKDILGYKYAVINLDEVQTKLIPKEMLKKLYLNVNYRDGCLPAQTNERTILSNAGNLYMTSHDNMNAHEWLESYLNFRLNIPKNEPKPVSV